MTYLELDCCSIYFLILNLAKIALDHRLDGSTFAYNPSKIRHPTAKRSGDRGILGSQTDLATRAVGDALTNKKALADLLDEGQMNG